VRTWADWETVHQPFELNWHKRKGVAWCSDDERFWGHWLSVFEFAGIGDPAQRTFLEVGCGPRPALKRFAAQGKVFAIDPLADEFKKITPPDWWARVTAYAQPAETLVSELCGRCDVVMCWNCLDHTIGWREILVNLGAYGSAGTVYALATDTSANPHVGHPGFEREDFFAELTRRFEVVEQRENSWNLELALVLKRL
jgi:hypothetical protein